MNKHFVSQERNLFRILGFFFGRLETAMIITAIYWLLKCEWNGHLLIGYKLNFSGVLLKQLHCESDEAVSYIKPLRTLYKRPTKEYME